MTEFAAFDLPAADPTTLQPDTALDNLETTTYQTGKTILRRVLQAQWETLDTIFVGEDLVTLYEARNNLFYINVPPYKNRSPIALEFNNAKRLEMHFRLHRLDQ